ncbi:hypothetical protein HQ865_09795 [Mucilaginibacter mali]|uniref:Uncharacterized protein n=1 Tax=Mucilaginibacter mali TaxID=2740462 RepID=A0A7D4UF89_9SPHI|nr:hypothetical protein [Mucilaginibacter mali]QKJ30036.1 hypothetical protein HQ865_09795 [Mucilaginibacter mali]
MKTICLITFSLLISSVCIAQATVEQAEKLTKKITAFYHVLQADPKVKHGLYQARHDKNMALASGLYENDKRVGLWHFFDYQGNLLQNFNYDKNVLTYEALDDQVNGFKYFFDKTVKATDTVTKPIKIGGRYFGYLNYMTLFKLPKEFDTESHPSYNLITVELLVSPGGHLADYIIHLPVWGGKKDLSFNIDMLSEEDKVFIPATINGEPVSARIIIPCSIDGRGNLTFGILAKVLESMREDSN